MSSPLRSATLCTFRLLLYGTTDAEGVRHITRREVEPMRLTLECGHELAVGCHRPHYNRELWKCRVCNRLDAARALEESEHQAARVVQAVRAREATRHAAGACPPACRLCFELQALQADAEL